VTQNLCTIIVKRIDGSDGEISIKYRTINYESGVRSAVAGEDYKHTEGTLIFKPTEVSAEIQIPIIERDIQKGADFDGIFGVELHSPSNGVKLSARDVCLIELVKDAKSARQADALNSLLKRIESEEKITWGQQFRNATMLHPMKSETGEIIEPSKFDAVYHFFAIGWKVLFSACPPPHYLGGWACFLTALCFIGAVTAIVGEVATLMGCVFGLKTGLTAITFVAIGTSLPDTFASKKAA